MEKHTVQREIESMKRRKTGKEAGIKRRFFLTGGICLGLASGFVMLVLVGFYQRVYEREYQSRIETLKNFAKQGGAVLEERLLGYLHTIGGFAECFSEGELHTEENMQKLQRMMERNNLDFERLGIAGLDGESWVTNGKRLNVSEKDYFKKAIQKERVITEGFHSRLVDERIFMVASPILDSKENVRGVLYGAVELDGFQLYRDADLQTLAEYVQVVDSRGYYIVQSPAKDTIMREENLFEELKNLECSMPVEELHGELQNGKLTVLEIRDQDAEYIACMKPLFTNEWYLVLVMNKNNIVSRVSYLLGNDIYWMIVKVGLAFAVICVVCVWYLWYEKKYIMELYTQMRLNEEMIRTAVSATKAVILFYDVRKDRLKIISSSHIRLTLPAVMEKASETLMQTLPVGERTKKQLPAIMKRLRSMEQTESFELDLIIDGTLRSYIVNLKVMKTDGSGNPHYVGIVEDITEKTSLEKEVKLQEGLFSSVVGFLVADLTDDRVLRSSEKFQRFYGEGTSYSGVFETALCELVVSEYHTYVASRISRTSLMEACANDKRRFKMEYPYAGRNGKILWVESDVRIERSAENGHEIVYFVLQDISDKKNTEQILKEKAERDDLTGLYNRGSATELVNQILGEPDAQKDTNAFVILDLDHFKNLNDTLGHQAGDQALVEVSHILQHHFRSYDIVCRLAGDEFVVFIRKIPIDAIPRNLDALLRALVLTYSKHGSSVTITASAGVAVAPECGMDFASLYRKADAALYEAKKDGKNTYRMSRS